VAGSAGSYRNVASGALCALSGTQMEKNLPMFDMMKQLHYPLEQFPLLVGSRQRAIGVWLVSIGVWLVSTGVWLVSIGVWLVSIGVRLVSIGVRLVSMGCG
jgi:hypothetical protein